MGDSQLASLLTGSNFYNTTFTVDSVGTCLGIINDFLAIQCDGPLLIQYQRIDQPRVQLVCNSFFVNHGSFGKVWLLVPEGTKNVLATVWYSTDDALLNADTFINVKNNVGTHKLALRNLNGKTLGVPIQHTVGYAPLVPNSNSNGITAITHKGDSNSLTVFTK